MPAVAHGTSEALRVVAAADIAGRGWAARAAIHPFSTLVATLRIDGFPLEDSVDAWLRRCLEDRGPRCAFGPLRHELGSPEMVRCLVRLP